MKIIISDFDGTLFIDNKVKKEDINKIKEFRSKGNMFIISTARNYFSVKKECLNFGIDVDYFFCDIGSCILDNNGNVLYRQYIDLNERIIIEDILEKYEKLLDIKRYGVKSLIEKGVENVIEYKIKGNIKDLEIIKSILDYKLVQTKLQITEDNKLILHSSTKEKIIEVLFRQISIDKSNIITIGDELDDFNMLNLYDGYRMEKCNIVLKNKINKSVNSIAELISLID